ncbi:MAG TPA: zf-TFIIB domain-containing protein [Polyangiaceae bacterium]|jgi:Zn-finger nucleic acid-binding protein
MLCPRDGAELKARIYEADVEIDECPTCKGTFLDQGELERIQAAVEKDHREALATPVDSVRAELAAEREEALPLVDCPKCGTSMERRRYGLGSQTVIDACPEGHGLWLDRGELEELEQFYERSQGDLKIPLMWRIWAAVKGRVGGKKA